MEGSMRYEQRMRKYWQKKLEDPLPKLPEDERMLLIAFLRAIAEMLFYQFPMCY